MSTTTSTRAATLAAIVLTAALAGCAAGPASSGGEPAGTGHPMPSGTHTMPDGTVMHGNLPAASPPSTSFTSSPAPGNAAGPSSAAAMICNTETADAVQHTFALPKQPPRTDYWKDHSYSCVYTLPGGNLTLSVKDLDTPGPGRAWFNQLRDRLPHTTPITGMQNLGFPAYQTPRGDVIFIKDSKTLWVNAAAVADKALPPGVTRTDTAYQIATAVLACWNHD